MTALVTGSPARQAFAPTVYRSRAADAAEGPRRYRPDIQGLRAIAVLLVVLYHLDVPLISAGYVGVDVFFVISGFLITGQLTRQAAKTGRISLRAFYAGRARRLLPAAAVVVVLTLLAVRIWDSVFQVRAVAWDAVFTAVYGMNYRLAAQGVDYQNAEGPVSPLQHMWSLAVEEQFYVFWPLVILCCYLIGRRRGGWIPLGAVCAGVVAVSLYLSITVTRSNPAYGYFSIHTRAWELAVGALVSLGAGWLNRMPALPAAALSWTGVIAISGSALCYTDSTPFPGSAALVPAIGAAMVIAAGCRIARGSAEVVLNRRPLQAVGTVSYAWYLVHWPMIVIAPLMVGEDLSLPVRLQLGFLSLWFAVLLRQLVEKPALRSRLRTALWLPTGLATSGVTAIAAVLVVTTLPSLVGSGSDASSLSLVRADTAQIQRALTGALTVRNAPANLTPALSDAPGDRPVTSKNGCHAALMAVDQGDCVFGDPNGVHTVVLYGDSHAEQWLPALESVGKRRHWKVVNWTKAACPVADIALVNEQIGRRYTECEQFRARTLGRIKLLGPDLVIAAQSDSVPGGQVTDTTWADATARTIGRIQDAKIPVAMLLDTPFPRRPVPNCLAEHLANVGACNFERAGAYLYKGRHAVMARTLQAARVPAVEPLDWFCTTAKCPAIVGNVLVYRDGSHMSATYSRWLAPMVEPLFVARSAG